MANILITGSAGFIGYHLSKRLLFEGHSIIGIDNLIKDENLSFKTVRLKALNNLLNYKHFDCSINDDQNKLSAMIQENNINLIVHLAAKTGVRDSESTSDSYFNTNILGSKTIFSLCSELNLPVIYASSSSVYGNQASIEFSEELRIQTPQSIYAISKIAAENLAHYYTQKYNLISIGLRFFTVYGSLPRKDMALWNFLHKIDNKQHITLYGKGEMVRDFTYVEDIVEGILKAIQSIQNGNKFKNELFNIGYGNGRKIIELINILENYLNKKAIIQYQNKSHEDMESTWADNTKAKNLLGFTPQFSLEEGVEKTISWYRKYNEK